MQLSWGGGWTSGVARGEAGSQMLLLKLVLEFVCNPDFSRKHNCATCVLYIIHYPLGAVCLPCLFDDCRAPRYLCHVL